MRTYCKNFDYYKDGFIPDCKLGFRHASGAGGQSVDYPPDVYHCSDYNESEE